MNVQWMNMCGCVKWKEYKLSHLQYRIYNEEHQETGWRRRLTMISWCGHTGEGSEPRVCGWTSPHGFPRIGAWNPPGSPCDSSRSPPACRTARPRRIECPAKKGKDQLILDLTKIHFATKVILCWMTRENILNNALCQFIQTTQCH